MITLLTDWRPRAIASPTVRVVMGLPIAWGVATAIASPQLGPAPIGAALAIAVVTLWQPGLGLLLVAAVTPAGGLFAAAPARAAELFAWSFLGAWLLAVWRPLAPSSWRRPAIVPALVYLAALTVSWLTLTIGGAAGVPVIALPSFLAHAFPSDYLVFASEQAEIWTLLQSAAGIALFVAAAGLIDRDRRLGRALAVTLVVSTAILALATVGDVVRQWAAERYGLWFVLRYLHGERFSLHLRDLNAAGSLYAMAGLSAVAFAVADRARRWYWAGLLVVIMPAAFLAGSRTSFVAFGAGVLLVAGAVSGWRPTRMRKAAAATAVAVVVIGGLLAADWRTDEQGATGRSMSLRSQFTESSIRMFSTAPVFGVGIGQYFPRSAEFLTPELRATYGNENAHNYFMQQFAELGTVGGLLFMWLVLPPLVRGWRTIREDPANVTLVALFTGTTAYLLTCLTGHPLLVPEASFPFWIALGAVAAIAPPRAPARRWHTAVVGAVGLFLVASIAAALRSHHAVATPPPEYGFHETDIADDGTSFRWMTGHAVAYIPDGRGFVRLRVRAPERRSAAAQPFVLETSVAGRVLDRRQLPFDEWVTYDVAVRRLSSLDFRRVDLRLNQIAWQPVMLGKRAAERPLGVKVAEIRWIPLD